MLSTPIIARSPRSVRGPWQSPGMGGSDTRPRWQADRFAPSGLAVTAHFETPSAADARHPSGVIARSPHCVSGRMRSLRPNLRRAASDIAQVLAQCQARSRRPWKQRATRRSRGARGHGGQTPHCAAFEGVRGELGPPAPAPPLGERVGVRGKKASSRKQVLGIIETCAKQSSS